MIRADQLWWTAAGGFLIIFLVTISLSTLDQRLIGGEAVWAKPIKFQIALAIHFATLAAVAGSIGEPSRAGSILFWTAVTSVGWGIFEIVYIMVQAARHEASHFNLSTPFHQVMYALMAIGAVFITIAAAIVGAMAWFDSDTSMAPATRTAVTVGLIGGTLMTLVIAFRMGGALDHHVGVEPSGSARFPLTGWSLSVGDLRVPHFFATHMMQVLPLAGLAADKALPAQTAVIFVWLGAAGWTILTLWLFQQALAGIPLPIWW